ncbi:unnamed protein product [Phaedon cochleariae]|uniref:Uncharacterized protein n=1 Tax=Phaedon cochleariae TaxID=80249 RepID=A0A9N9SJZ1_PHACE|nr:unnamed protein product [Phaedon cochleariae]
MEKDKSRGLKHIKNKQKYKGNSIKKVESVPTKSTPALDSNWDRYELEGRDEDFISTHRKDFSTLAAAPIGQGNHFQFKSDKALAEEVEIENNKELFHLDLKKLQENILTIPFYARLNIPEDIFSEQQILVMKTEAEENSRKVKGKYEPKCDPIEDDEINAVQDEFSQIVDTVEEYSSKDLLDTQVEIFLSSDNDIIVPDIQKKPVNSNDDLELWLDDILGE